MEKSFEIFFSDFVQKTGVPLQMTKENLEIRRRLEEQLHHLLPMVKLGLNRHNELKKKEKLLKVYESRKIKNTNHNYKIVKNNVKIVPVPPNSYALNCRKCRLTILFPCNEVRRCDEQYNCTMCMCSRKQHSLQHFRYEYESKEIEFTNWNKKRNYDAAHKGHEEVIMDIDRLKREHSEVEERVKNMITQAKKYQNRLNDVSLGRSHDLTESQYIDTLIESEKKELSEGYQQRIETLEEFKELSHLSRDIHNLNSEKDTTSWLKKRLSQASTQTNTERSTVTRRHSTRNHKRPSQYTS